MQSDYSTGTVLRNSTNNATLWNNSETLNGSGTTTNTFSNTEFYISNYQSASQNKQGRSDGVLENNSSTATYRIMGAGLFRDNTAITSITIVPSSGNFVSGSSFFLYGIKRN
jgi:hypothetical protein